MRGSHQRIETPPGRGASLFVGLGALGTAVACLGYGFGRGEDRATIGLVRHLGDVERGWFKRVMAGEDARHLGHADLLRERIDGAVGQ